MSLYPAATAGSQLDLNHLWQQVQELSGLLAANRESAQTLVRRADEIRNRTESGDTASLLNGLSNGHVNGDGPDVRALEETNERLQKELESAKADNEDLSKLVADYSAVLEKVLEGLRVYAHEHSTATINIHSSYTNQLAAERQANAQLRQEHADDKARLVRISTLLREAYNQETALGPDVVIARLKAENKALREALELPPLEGGEEDDEEGEGKI